MDKILILEVVIDCPPEEAFTYFTENEKLESWLTEKANVEPVEGGSYELFWQPAYPDVNSTIGCKILALEHPRFLSFEWKGPIQFQAFMNNADPLTHVAVMFHPSTAGTNVTLLHNGWRDTEEWEEARAYFTKAWQTALDKLRAHVQAGQ